MCLTKPVGFHQFAKVVDAIEDFLVHGSKTSDKGSKWNLKIRVLLVGGDRGDAFYVEEMFLAKGMSN